MLITKHARRRMRERCKITSKRSQDRLAHNAFKYGIKHSETSGDLNRWITALYFKQHQANNVRIYNGRVFIFCDQRLVTILFLPKNIQNNLDSMILK